MVAVDAVFVVIWLSAFATQAAYNSADSCGSACGISKGIVALGFFVLYVHALLYRDRLPVWSILLYLSLLPLHNLRRAPRLTLVSSL